MVRIIDILPDEAYAAIRVVAETELAYDNAQYCPPADIQPMNSTFIYVTYYAAKEKFHAASIDIADDVWNWEKYNWAPVQVTDTIKRGMRVGYLWSQGLLKKEFNA